MGDGDWYLVGRQGLEELEKPRRWSLWRSERGRNSGWARGRLVAGAGGAGGAGGWSGVEIDGGDGAVTSWCSRNEDFITVGHFEVALGLGRQLSGSSGESSETGQRTLRSSDCTRFAR